MSMLTINNLTKHFGDQKAVNNISFSLKKGEILAVLGESGSGKTTLLHLIAALQEPDAGTLLLEGKKIPPPSQKLIAGHPAIKLVRQDYGLFPNMSIRENIAYELRFYEEKYRQKRVDKLLKISGLQKIQTHLPRQVSGGEQQRAVIVRALAEEPKLLLLDEPFSHLDSLNKQRLKAEILQIIHEDSAGGTPPDGSPPACIFVTHDATDAYALANRLAVMRKGKFLQIGEPHEIYEKPANQYVAEVTGAANLIPSEVFRQLSARFSDVPFQKTVVIRPEKIKMGDTSSDFRATVEEITFLGAFYEIKIKVASHCEMRLFSFEKLVIGSEINLQIVDYHVIS